MMLPSQKKLLELLKVSASRIGPAQRQSGGENSKETLKEMLKNKKDDIVDPLIIFLGKKKIRPMVEYGMGNNPPDSNRFHGTTSSPIESGYSAGYKTLSPGLDG